MIARLQAVDVRADDFHDTGTLMAGDDPRIGFDRVRRGNVSCGTVQHL